MILPPLKSTNPKSHEFAAKAKTVKDIVEHHIREEENEMFAKARQLFDDAELRELGDMMQARRESVEAMWDNPLLRPVKKIQSAAHKLMPTKVKNVKATALAKAVGREARR